jgi:hypothetical protein
VKIHRFDFGTGKHGPAIQAYLAADFHLAAPIVSRASWRAKIGKAAEPAP